MAKLPGFVGGSAYHQSPVIGGVRSVNIFPSPITDGNKAQSALFPAPGKTLMLTLPKQPGRGMFFENNRLFAVGGNELYEIDASWVATSLGEVETDPNPVQFASNGDGGNELAVSSGGRLDLFDLQTSVFTQNVEPDVNFIGQVDGFFVALDTVTSTLKSSLNLDGLSWDGTDIAQRVAASDRWLAMLVASREIYLFGEKTGEVWYNRGAGSGMPFVQRQGAFFQNGIIAPYSLTLFGDSMAWLGRTGNGSGAVYWMNGYTPEELSTPAVRWAIQTYEDSGDLHDVVGWSYEREGHEFYVLTFPDARRTWVYDRLTKVWHERGYWDVTMADYTAERAQFHANAFGRNLVQDYNGGGIYALSSLVFTDLDGRGVRRLRQMPHLSNENKLIYFPYAELECDRGNGLLGDGSGVPVQGETPMVVLQTSNDGGQSWGTDRERTTGAKGKYKTRVRWNQCGSGRDRVWRLWTTDPVPQRWYDFYFGVR